MNPTTLQFIHLENLLAETAGTDILRVHILEQSETTTSNILTRKEITIGLCVRMVVCACAKTTAPYILSWYGQLDKFSFYLHEPPVHGDEGNGRFPEQDQYEKAWQQATRLQNELVSLLRQDEYTVRTDGVIEIGVPNLLHGQTSLIDMPITV